jgi:hypothetical protein
MQLFFYNCKDWTKVQYYWTAFFLSPLPELGALPSVWDTRQSPDYTRQKALGSDFVGKDVFAECLAECQKTLGKEKHSAKCKSKKMKQEKNLLGEACTSS